MTYAEQHQVFEAKTEEAKGLSASCPNCGSDCDVHAQFKQATRQQPIQFLGFSALCMGACYSPFGGGMSFTPDEVQAKLLAA